jgi:hypothetical protein
MTRTIRANEIPMPWRERLKQEFATAQDTGTREQLLAVYAVQIAALSELEREELFAKLADNLSC